MKTITICGKVYPINCNGLTHLKYKELFKRGIIKDIQVINGFYLKQTMMTKALLENNKEINDKDLIKQLSLSMTDDIDEYIHVVTMIAYICIYTADQSICSYEEWLKSIDRINTNDEWIVEVTEFAVSCFC